MINSCFYYYILKDSPEISKYLTACFKEVGKGFNLALMQQNSQPAQIWMFKSNETEDAYYIVDCSSGLVLEVLKDRTLQLHHNRGKDNQMFKIVNASSEKMIFTISQYIRSSTIFVRDGILVSDLMQENDPQGKWVFKRAIKNKYLSESAIVECQNSGYVMEAADNAEKEGAALRQGQWQGVFAQRWIFVKMKEFYFIKNMKSGLVATVKGKKAKEGLAIVQEKQNDNHHRFQLWSVQERGHRLFSIRLASQQQLFLGAKNNQMTEGAEVNLVKDPFKLWRIVSDVVI